MRQTAHMVLYFWLKNCDFNLIFSTDIRSSIISYSSHKPITVGLNKLISSFQTTIVPSSKGPHSASILCHSNGVGAAAGHLSNTTDVLHQRGRVTTLTVTVTCDQRKNTEQQEASISEEGFYWSDWNKWAQEKLEKWGAYQVCQSRLLPRYKALHH